MTYHTWNQMLAHLRQREQNNHTTDGIVEGARGSGKSNTAGLIMLSLEPRFDFERHYVYDDVDLARTLPLLRGQKHVKQWFDEAKNVLYRRQAMTRVNKQVSLLMSQIREMQGTRFWVSPDSNELESFLTKDQADICLTTPARGHVRAWRFWKNWHSPPGSREGRWIPVFSKSNVPDLAEVAPRFEATMRRYKTAGFNRVTQGVVHQITKKNNLLK